MLFHWLKRDRVNKGGDASSRRLKQSRRLYSAGHAYQTKRDEREAAKFLVHELRPGMFVSQLDRPWLETPFKLQGFHIRHESDIDEIAKYCKFVYVDNARFSDSRFIGKHSIDNSEKAVHTLADSDGFRKDRQLYEQATELTFGFLDSIALGRVGSTKSIETVVSSCVESVLANPYTMILVAQMAEKQAALEYHAMSCCALAASFGKFLNFEGKELENLALGALLHDVGMLKVATHIHEKKHITKNELDLLRAHVVHGRNILMDNTDFWPAIDVAHSHHERIDGQGYPRGLRGEAIPYNARIVSIVEAYDTMVSNHSYKKTVSPTEAMSELYNNAGKQFDRRLVESFIRFLGLYPLGSLVQLGSGEIGIVVEKNPFYKVLPKVVVVLDGNGDRIRPREVDLYKELDINDKCAHKIVRTLRNGSFGINISKFIEEGILEVGKSDCET